MLSPVSLIDASLNEVPVLVGHNLLIGDLLRSGLDETSFCYPCEALPCSLCSCLHVGVIEHVSARAHEKN